MPLWPNRHQNMAETVSNAVPKAPDLAPTVAKRITGDPAAYARRKRADRQRRAALDRKRESWLFRALVWLPLLLTVAYVAFFIAGFFVGFRKNPFG